MAGKKRPERDEKRGVESAEAALNLLSEPEERLCLTCLRYFRGDWDLYLDFLAGPRAAEEQRRQELPLVERLKERDQRTGFLELMLEDEVVAAAEHMDFEGLLRMWDLAMLIDPEADPFREPEGAEPDLDDADLGPGAGPPSYH
jgi:hypothetical protein